MKKVLYTATSDIHIKTFHLPYLKWFKENGYEIHLAVENRGNIDLSFCDKIFYLPFKRLPYSKVHLSAYKSLKNIISENNYTLIHCHTPVVSVLTRLAARKERKKGTVILYTAHGFHFYKEAPLKYWLIFYPVEYLLSYITDAIITINQEDYNLINSKWGNKYSFYIKGIGADNNKFKPITPDLRKELRKELGFNSDDFILLYIAEFIPRKNHKFIIESLPFMIQYIPKLKVVFAGKGVLLNKMKKLSSEIGIDRYINFFGFRSDVHILAAIADVGISSSKQEGLGLGLVEEMMCGIPVVATKDRGHKEIIIQGINGFMFPQNDRESFINYIKLLYEDPALREKMGKAALEKAQEFTIGQSVKSMADIYKRFL